MILSLFSCSTGIPKAKVTNNEGFCDIDFVITKIETLSNGSHRITANNLLENNEVYISIIINNKWDEKPIENANGSFYWGTGTLETGNAGYKVFVNTLAKFYSLKEPENIRNENINIGIVGLANDPQKMNTNDTRMKAFFNPDSNNEEIYAELFINVNMAKKVLQFHEKDSDYRVSLLRALSGEK